MTFLIEERKPKPEEKRGMVLLRKAMDEAFSPGVERTNVRSARPGGRLLTTEYLQQQARLERGHPFDKRRKMWDRLQVDRTPRRPLNVWFLGDVSGSMGSMAVPLAYTRWAISHATHQSGGKSGAVLYGEHVMPVQAMGEVTSDIEVWACNEGWERAASAWSAAMYDKDFIRSRDQFNVGVFFTDFQYSKEIAQLKGAMMEAKDAGVHLIAVTPSFYHTDNPKQFGITEVVECSDPVTTAQQIGRSIIRAAAR